MTPLSMVKVGTTVRVTHLLPNQPAHLRLRALGLIVGAKLSVLSSEFGGPMVVTLRGSQLAIGYELVNTILVETLNLEDL